MDLHPVTINDREAVAMLRDEVIALWGDAALMAHWPPSTASDDIALLLQRVPGCYFNVGNGVGDAIGMGGCPVHHARYDFNDDILPSTASLLVKLVRRFLVGDVS
jgi:hippurate hydrolase